MKRILILLLVSQQLKIVITLILNKKKINTHIELLIAGTGINLTNELNNFKKKKHRYQ